MADNETEAPETNETTEGRGKEGYLVQWLLKCRTEAEGAKKSRSEQTAQNYDAYNMRHDFSHKIEGQSREVLPKQFMAVEQTAAYFKEALVDLGNWWSAEATDPRKEETLAISAASAKKLVDMQFEKADFYGHVSRGMKAGQLCGKIITKVSGEYAPKIEYVSVRSLKSLLLKKELKAIKKKVWQLRLSLISHKNYFPDPHGDLYEIEDMWVDFHELLACAEEEPDLYDCEAVEGLGHSGGTDDAEEQEDKRNRSQQDTTYGTHRRRVKLSEYWGTVLDDQGKILYENVTFTVANDKVLIRAPTHNPNWHQESPYVAGDLLEAEEGKWPSALMDAPTKLNTTMTEVFNLIIDGGMRAVGGVGQLRAHYLEDESQVANGVRPATTLMINEQCPPGMKVYENVKMGEMPPDALSLFNIIAKEFSDAALRNDMLSGGPGFGKDVSATRIVETNHAITSTFQGLTKNVEKKWITPVLRKSWLTSLQFVKEMDHDEVVENLGEAQGNKLLGMSASEIFASAVKGLKFKVFGLSETLKKQANLRNYLMLLQTIGGSEPMTEAFVQKYSFNKFLGNLMHLLGLEPERLEIPKAEQETMSPSGPPAEAPPEGGAQGGADMMSQVPGAQNGTLGEQLGEQAGARAGIPYSNFPNAQRGN